MQVKSALLKFNITFHFHKALHFLFYLPISLREVTVILILEMATV